MTPELARNQAKPTLDLLQFRRFGLGLAQVEFERQSHLGGSLPA